MATTSSKLATGKVLAGQRGTGKQGRGAVVLATAALGLSLMVGGVLRQGQQATPAHQPATAPLASDTHVASAWDFREDHRAATNDRFIPGQFTYREDRRAGATVAFAADQFTYREDRRTEVAPPFVANQFTYREDRRER